MEQAEKLLSLLLDVSQPNLLLFRRLLRLVFRFDRLQSFVENCPRFFGFTSSFSIADVSLSKVFENLETIFQTTNFLGSHSLICKQNVDRRPDFECFFAGFHDFQFETCQIAQNLHGFRNRVLAFRRSIFDILNFNKLLGPKSLQEFRSQLAPPHAPPPPTLPAPPPSDAASSISLTSTNCLGPNPSRSSVASLPSSMSSISRSIASSRALAESFPLTVKIISGL